MKDIIFCIIGESGSGKTTIAELLEEEGYNYIQSYTTREPRYKGERGHIFTTVKDYFDATIQNEFENNMIAWTKFDNNYYWATREQYKNKGVSIYIIDVEGVKNLKRTVKDAIIVPVYLCADKQIRIDRMIKRKAKDMNLKSVDSIPEYMINHVKRRVEHDDNAFYIKDINSMGAYVVDAGGSVKTVLESVKRIIEKESRINKFRTWVEFIADYLGIF